MFPPLRLAAAIVSLAPCVSAQTPLFPLKDLKPGMRGIGKTVFSGSAIEEFQVEILGVLENVGPHQSLITVDIKAEIPTVWTVTVVGRTAKFESSGFESSE